MYMSMGDITHSIHEILKSTYQIVNMRGPADVLFKNYQRHCFDDQPENGPFPSMMVPRNFHL